jgi:hypothetical protein
MIRLPGVSRDLRGGSRPPERRWGRACALALCHGEQEDGRREILVWLRRGCVMGEHERCFGGCRRLRAVLCGVGGDVAARGQALMGSDVG